ncbi:MAG: replication factor C large subunit [Candidatus Diapherotrites archaeon]|nr:replication factor C large subunit [Candidatus Diapherotrites archaeon]
MSELWTDRFFPKDFSEFVGNSEAADFVRAWAEKWQSGKPQQPLLLYGSPGTGKTCLATMLAKFMGWLLFEMNASDFRTKDVIERVAGAASQGASLGGTLRLVLLDEVDGLQGNADRGGAGAMAKILKESKNPLILTANDIYGDQKMLPLRGACVLVQFKKINYLSIAKRLCELLQKEGVPFDPEAVKTLARSCAGDMRSALLDAQTLVLCGKIDLAAVQSLGYRERQHDIFKTIEAVFKGSTVGEIRRARQQTEVDDEMLFLWVDENIPRHFTKGNDSAAAFERLSRADVFLGRIGRRQHYGFLRYSGELATSGVALSREHEYPGWIHYQFPGLLRRLGGNKGARNLRKQVAQKIGAATHSSTSTVITEDLPYLRMLFADKKQAARLAAAFDFTAEEIAFLLGAKPDSKKTKSVFEEAAAIRQSGVAKRKPLQAVDGKTLAKFEEPTEELEEPAGQSDNVPENSEGQTTLL